MSKKTLRRKRRMPKQRRELLITIIFIAAVVVGTYGIVYGTEYALNNPQPFAVVEGTSMLPNYRQHDLVIVHGVAPSTLKVGDVIVFHQPGYPQSLIIHRVKEIITSNTQPIFVTKGDNNAGPDPWSVQTDNVIGKVVYQVPSVGIVFIILSSPIAGSFTLGNLVSLTLIALLIFFTFMTPEKQKKRKPKGPSET